MCMYVNVRVNLCDNAFQLCANGAGPNRHEDNKVRNISPKIFPYFSRNIPEMALRSVWGSVSCAWRLFVYLVLVRFGSFLLNCFNVRLEVDLFSCL